jgi:hypothetical protein
VIVAERIDTKAVLDEKTPIRERAKAGPWGPWKENFRETYDALAQEITDHEAGRKTLRALQEYHDCSDRNFEGQCEDCQEWEHPSNRVLTHREDCEWLALASAEGKARVLAPVIGD